LKRREAAGRCRGLTLVELLVAMVIFSLVMTLVSQAVSQVGHVVRVADEASQALGGRWSRGSAVSLAFANLVAPLEAGDRPFVGQPASIEAASSQPLEAPDLGVGPLALRLRPGPGPEGDTVMDARFGRANGDAAAWKTVARFDGRAEFAFRNRAGEWLPQWPPLTARPALVPELVPSAVMVRDAGSGRLFMAYPVTGGETRQRGATRSPFEAGSP